MNKKNEEIQKIITKLFGEQEPLDGWVYEALEEAYEIGYKDGGDAVMIAVASTE